MLRLRAAPNPVPGATVVRETSVGTANEHDEAARMLEEKGLKGFVNDEAEKRTDRWGRDISFYALQRAFNDANGIISEPVRTEVASILDRYDRVEFEAGKNSETVSAAGSVAFGAMLDDVAQLLNQRLNGPQKQLLPDYLRENGAGTMFILEQSQTLLEDQSHGSEAEEENAPNKTNSLTSEKVNDLFQLHGRDATSTELGLKLLVLGKEHFEHAGKSLNEVVLNPTIQQRIHTIATALLAASSSFSNAEKQREDTPEDRSKLFGHLFARPNILKRLESEIELLHGVIQGTSFAEAA